MNLTVFFTVLSGVITYVLGQFILKLVIEPVHEMKKTIGSISHSLVEHANVIQNPGVPNEEIMRATSQHLRKLSSQLHGHLYLVPAYRFTAKFLAKVFGVGPSQTVKIPTDSGNCDAPNSLIGLFLASIWTV